MLADFIEADESLIDGVTGLLVLQEVVTATIDLEDVRAYKNNLRSRNIKVDDTSLLAIFSMECGVHGPNFEN